MFVLQLIQKEGNSMELVKSKGMIIFTVLVLGLSIASSMCTKKYDENKENQYKDSYLYEVKITSQI